MRTYRFPLVAALLGALLLPLADQAVSAPRRQGRLKIKKKAVRPTRLPGSGGPVYLNLEVTKAGSRINEVRAQAHVTGGGGGPVVVLTRQGKTYRGNCIVPASYASKPSSAAIYVYVTSSEGQEPTWRLATVSLAPGSSGPPPPPPGG
jgi:hypothetical protein